MLAHIPREASLGAWPLDPSWDVSLLAYPLWSGSPGNATFVVDGRLPVCHTAGEERSCGVENWALPEIDTLLCDRCGVCVEQCPTGAVEMGEEGPIFVRPSDCAYCAVCEAICPQGAIACAYEIVWETGD